MTIEKLKDANYVIYKMYHDKFIDKLYKFPIYLVFKIFKIFTNWFMAFYINFKKFKLLHK